MLVVRTCGAAGVQGSGLASGGVLVLVLCSCIHINSIPSQLALNASSPSSIVLKILKVGKTFHFVKKENWHQLSFTGSQKILPELKVDFVCSGMFFRGGHPNI